MSQTCDKSWEQSWPAVLGTELAKLLSRALQVDTKYTEAAKDLVTETWISLPRDRRPKEWDNIEEPMVRLKVNLYGHPLAGLIWENAANTTL